MTTKTKQNNKTDGLNMEKIELPLGEYSQAQKLDLLETLWHDITKDEKNFRSPDWHKPIIEKSLSELKNGKAEVLDWEESKKVIAKNISNASKNH